MKKSKRRLALLLIAVMLITALPIAAMAADPGVTVYSTQNLDEADLTGYLEEDLKAVPLDVLLPDVDLSDVTELAWDAYANDTMNNFTIVNTADETIDLSRLIRADYNGRWDSSSGQYVFTELSYDLEILKSDQLDRTTRYVVPVKVPNLAALLHLDAYQADGTSIGSMSLSSGYTYGNQVRYTKSTGLPIWDVWDAVVSMELNSAMTALADLTARVYEGYYSDAYAAYASRAEITDYIWETGAEGDYYADWTAYPEFTVVLERDNAPVQVLHVTAGMTAKGVDFALDMYNEDGEKISVSSYGETYSRENYYYVNPDYNKWESGMSTLKLRYRNSDDVSAADNSGIACDEYENQTDVTVYTGYYANETALWAALGARETWDITRYIWGDSSIGYEDDYTDWEYPIAFTVVVRDQYGSTAYVVPFYVHMSAVYTPTEQPAWVRVYDPLQTEYTTGSYRDVSGYPQQINDDSYYFTMNWPTNGTNGNQPYSAYGEYYVTFYISGWVDSGDLLDQISSIKDSDGAEIKDTLFPPSSYSYSSVRYLVDFSEGKQPATFTVTYADDTEQVITLRTLPAQPPTNTSSGSTDTYFNVTTVTVNGTSYTPYSVPDYVDSSYSDGFRTLFINVSKEDLETGEVDINFSNGTGVRMYVDHDEQGDPLGNTGRSGSYRVTEVESGVPILFSAASESGTHLRNYWITLVAKGEDGPELWVNGQNDGYHIDAATGLTAREVYMTGIGYYDILFANVGNQPLEDLTVTLSGSSTVRLDDYWTIGQTRTLTAFTDVTPSTDLGTAYQQLNNMAKIRIWPESAGNIDAILTISADGQDPVSIKLTGKVGTSIISSSVPDGVKYVPYSSLIQTNYSGSASSRPTFRIESGVLPQGVSIRETGEIYGVPQVWSSSPFTFTVGMYQNGQMLDSRTFTMTIDENTDENVWKASDITYEIAANGEIGVDQGEYHYVIDLDTYELEDPENRTFISKGPYIYYQKVFLDGKELTAYVDYIPGEGSTPIVLSEGAIGNTNGTHTLAIEFREGGSDGTLKRTAQNYTIEGGINPPAPQQPSGNGTGSKPSTPSTPSTPTTPSLPYRDVATTNWAYDDIRWAYDNGLMEGVGDNNFSPDTYVSQAQIVTVLARLANVDLTEYGSVSVDGAAPGEWYTAAAAWAQQTGILPDNTSFNGENGGYSRDNMAIMLVKYLASLGVDTTVGNDINFDDMDQMSDAGRDAFRVLCHYGIFKGVGNNKMDPSGVTTRAQFAALLHRIYDFATNR